MTKKKHVSTEGCLAETLEGSLGRCEGSFLGLDGLQELTINGVKFTHDPILEPLEVKIDEVEDF